MFKIILVAIDASDQRHTILAQAAEIAIRFEAELNVVSVCDLTQHSEMLAVDPIPEIFTTLEEGVGDLLAEARHQLQEAGVTCRTYALDGEIAGQIVSLAERICADLIVIGHRYLSWLRRLMESSVGRNLMAETPCNMMIVVDP